MLPGETMEGFDESKTAPDDGNRSGGGKGSGGGEGFRARSTPESIGRFQLVKVLGAGAFGVVYHGYDPELDREVAVKLLPRLPAVRQEDEGDIRLDEARALGRLDHPNIVPIHDVGTLPSGEMFIVSKLIEGVALSQIMEESQGDPVRAAELLTMICEALQHAHRERIYHRDVKPANILVDRQGVPFLIDFGIALLNERFGDPRRFRRAGTPQYMSPEQARGEGHLLDGRSDIWAVGVILYEWLTGRRPFEGANYEEILDRVTRLDPKPLRQLRDSIDPELERIVLRALSKLPSNRYSSALDLAADLRSWKTARTAPDSATVPSSKFTPRGLQSYSAADAGFFLELLPGPRDRRGLPTSVRFWKEGIEEQTPGAAFRVGLLYGPSGSGKSSFLRAAVLPHLAYDVQPVVVEAAGSVTEERLREALMRRMPSLSASTSLSAVLRAAREGSTGFGGRKLLLILDQFEQWLHADWMHRGPCDLIDALRQCDGQRVQALLVVRDDFWLATSQFMHQLEVELHTATNCACVEAFDRSHAEQVLIKLGRAYQRLPPEPNLLSEGETAFVSQAVELLSGGSTVEPVLLTVFAELFKVRPWDPRQLKDLGGAAGLGIRFLDDSLQSRHANPDLRNNLPAVEMILAGLIPPAGSSLKSRARPESELMEVSRLSHSPEVFHGIIRSLDRDLRILTPAESGESGRGREYQLTHDFLVHALRDWIDRRSMATLHGRIGLQLRQVTEVWTSNNRKRRFLPTFWEWLLFLVHTRRSQRSETQQALLRETSKRNIRRLALSAAAAGCLVGGYWSLAGLYHGHIHSENLLNASGAQLPVMKAKAEPYRHWVYRILKKKLAAASDHAPQSEQNFNALYVLVDHSPALYAHRLFEEFLLNAADPGAIEMLSTALSPHADAHLSSQLETLASGLADGGLEKRMRSALILANLPPHQDFWNQETRLQLLANELVHPRLENRAAWAAHFRKLHRSLRPPARLALEQPLHEAFRGASPSSQTDADAVAASTVLAELIAGDDEALLELLDEARLNQLAPLTGKLADPRIRNQTIPKLQLRTAAQPGAADTVRVSNAILALFALGEPSSAWAAVETVTHPGVFARLHLGVRDAGADPSVVSEEILRPNWRVDASPWFDLHQLDSNGAPAGPRPDRRLHIALLGIAEWSWEDLEGFPRETWFQRVEELWRSRPEGRLHSAAHCVLQAWRKLPPDAPPSRPLPADRPLREGEWFSSYNGHVFIAVRPDGPEPGLPLAGIATMETTTAQFKALSQRSDPTADEFMEGGFDKPNAPVVFVAYEEIAAYFAHIDPWDPRFRLPSGSEWLGACLGQISGPTYCGAPGSEKLLLHHEWLAENSQSSSHPVGSLKPNPLGFFDMLGNCVEVCSPDPDPTSAQRYYLMTGFSYQNGSSDILAQHQAPTGLTGRENWVTFRAACDLPGGRP